MIPKLADDDLRNQSGAGDASCNRSLWRRRTRHTVFAIAASILRSHILVHVQFRRHVFENLRYVLANPILRTSATTAGLFFGRQVQFMPMVWQTGKIELAPTTASMAGDLLTRPLGRGGSLHLVGRSQIKQVLLPVSFNDPFSAAPLGPSLQSVEFLNGRWVFVFQFLLGGSCRIQYAAELRHLPLVPNAKSVDVPEQNLDPVALTIQEQEPVTRQRVLVKRLLSRAHQAIEAEVHLDRRRANKDPQVGKVRHGRRLLPRSALTALMTSTITA